ncbi:flavodoxin domain-containing protein [Limibacillus halophilus]|uniref:MioC protein n=1 Tax=Limibacillus halophilus TaxID=1579333 RepID=A0A839SW16_9PROT|nr:flavodoxin domain-containing protein [Limibacillus halophilus]MBB3066987.1 MioC protein [Limibacillus halophilus]
MERLDMAAFVATMTGQAELLAEDLADKFKEACDLGLILLEEAEPADLAAQKLALIVSSTYGVGEVPEPTKPVYARIKHERPDLSGLIYGVISLGDSTYHNTFARGGQLWDDLFAKCGAWRVGDILKLDATVPEDSLNLASTWFETWLEAARAQLEAPASAGGVEVSAGGR